MSEEKRGQKRANESETYGILTGKFLKSTSGNSEVKSENNGNNENYTSNNNNNNNNNLSLASLETVMGIPEISQKILNELPVSGLSNFALTSVNNNFKSSSETILVNRLKKLKVAKKLLFDKQFKDLNNTVDPEDEYVISKLVVEHVEKLKNKYFVDRLTLSQIVLLTGNELVLNAFLNKYFLNEKEIQWAFQFAPVETIKFLVEKLNRSVNVDALVWACSNTSSEVMQYLLSDLLKNHEEIFNSLSADFIRSLVTISAEKENLNLLHYFIYTGKIDSTVSLLNVAAKVGSLAHVKQVLACNDNNVVDTRNEVNEQTWHNAIGSGNLELLKFVETQLTAQGFVLNYENLKPEVCCKISESLALNCDDVEIVAYLKGKNFNFTYCLTESARTGNGLLFSVLLEYERSQCQTSLEKEFSEYYELFDDAVEGGNLDVIKQLAFIPCSYNTFVCAIYSGIPAVVDWVAKNWDIASCFAEHGKDVIEGEILDALGGMGEYIMEGEDYEDICKTASTVFEEIEKLASPSLQM